MENRNTKVKIVITVVVLLSTLAFVGLGTFAWYTLSKKGETSGIVVSMSRNGDEWPFEFIEHDTRWTTIEDVWNAEYRDESNDWGKSVTLAEVHYTDEEGHDATKPADECYQLRPISTSDLETWYLPEYNKTGEVAYLSVATFSAVANINRFNPTASETGEDIPSNYIYYYDMWVRTISEKYDYNLHLNNPTSADNIDPELYDEYDFGTFVLPALVAGENEVATISKAGYDMSTCLRVGFAVYENEDPDDITKEHVKDFWIYEPNCDLRAKYFKNFSSIGANYEMEKNYVYVLGNDKQNKTVKSQLELVDGQDYVTMLPYIEDGKTYQSFKDIDAGLPESQKKTLKQYHSEWKDEISNDDLNEGKLDSTYIKTFGGFMNKYSGKEGLTGIDTPTFSTLTKGTPVHIRVYVWMEGQDVDCWNSSLAGSLKIGLEFRGDVADGS